jgi:hypothetical protein
MLNANANAFQERKRESRLLHRKTANTPRSPPATPTIALAVCIAAFPVDAVLDGAPSGNDAVAAAPPADCAAPPLITLASELFGPPVLVTLTVSLVALANTRTLVALAPHTQWFIVPSEILAYMFIQDGAEEAEQAMASGSL